MNLEETSPAIWTPHPSSTLKIEDVNFTKATLYIKVRSNPSACLEKAREIATAILGHAPWHFIVLEFRSPMEQDLGDKMDSEWVLYAEAVLK